MDTADAFFCPDTLTHEVVLPHRVGFDMMQIEPYRLWCEEQVGPRGEVWGLWGVGMDTITFRFATERDATLFKTFWG